MDFKAYIRRFCQLNFQRMGKCSAGWSLNLKKKLLWANRGPRTKVWKHILGLSTSWLSNKTRSRQSVKLAGSPNWLLTTAAVSCKVWNEEPYKPKISWITLWSPKARLDPVQFATWAEMMLTVAKKEDFANWSLCFAGAIFYLPLLAYKWKKIRFCNFNIAGHLPIQTQKPVIQRAELEESQRVVSSDNNFLAKAAETSPKRRTSANSRENCASELLQKTRSILVKILLQKRAVHFFQGSQKPWPLQKVIVVARCKARWVENLYFFNHTQSTTQLYSLHETVNKSGELAFSQITVIHPLRPNLNEIVGN